MPSRRHGMYNTKIYKVWHSMKRRATRRLGGKFDKLYFEKGIGICDEWSCELGFENFYKWSMENGYQENMTIDRIDSNGNYEPSNCRWVDYKVQNNNTSRNHYVTYNGETHTIGEWATILGINYNTLNQRIWEGIPPEIAFSKKKFKHGEITKLVKELEE